MINNAYIFIGLYIITNFEKNFAGGYYKHILNYVLPYLSSKTVALKSSLNTSFLKKANEECRRYNNSYKSKNLIELKT